MLPSGKERSGLLFLGVLEGQRRGGSVDPEASHSGGGRSKKNEGVVAPLQLVESVGGLAGGTVGSGGLGFQVAEVS